MIRCLGVIGKSDEPLYLRDFVETNSLSEEKESTIEDEDKPFVFFSEMNKRCTLNHQLIMHSALDTFEEAILQQKNKLGRNKSWYGKLCRIDNMRVFGYMTSTKIKFMVGVEDFEHGDNQWKKSSLEIEAGLKEFFCGVHELYVEYALNPFSELKKKKINSHRFSTGVSHLVQSFNDY